MTLITKKPSSTSALLLGIWSHLSGRRRIQLGLLLVVILASGAAELLSLGAVLPFLAVLSDPQRLWKQELVQKIGALVGINEASQLVLPASLTFAASAIVAAMIRMINLSLNGRVAAAVGSDLSYEAYRRTLYQPYGVHVQRNSATVITGVSGHISSTVTALNNLLQVISSAVVAAFLFSGLLLIDSTVAMLAAILFGSAYWVMAITVHHELRGNGEKITEASTQQLKALQEGLGAIREVLLDGSQKTYLQIYQRWDRPQRQLIAKNAFLGTFPRYALEALGMVALAILGGLLVYQRGSGAAVISVLGVLAVGAQRLLPALQQIYSGWANLKGYNLAIKGVLTLLEQPLPPVVNVSETLQMHVDIQLVNVHFRYRPEQKEVLKGIDIQIRRGDRVGLIGSTGSGKSTLVDVLMGLLTPTSGQVLVDGADINDLKNPGRSAAWRAAIAHVPQSIYLADSSIAENIALGVPREKIDLNRVKWAAEQAQISSFIDSRPEGYKSYVGERGILLSGGQRQRIGIARALYKQSSVLVLDEATSALDNATEQAFMRSVNALSRSLTIVIIAHRLSTLDSCDWVIRLEQGCVVEAGVPEKVLDSTEFQLERDQ